MKMITTRLEEITPELAKRYLACNVKENRSLSGTTVAKYAADMVNGDFVINNSAICFNDLGQLIDGQHRLKACVQAGVPFKTFVTRNLPAESYKVIDTGRPRDAKAALKYSHSGDRLFYSTDTIAVARAMFQFLPAESRPSRRPTVTEIEKFISDNYDIMQTAHALSTVRGKRVPSVAVVGALMAHVNGVPLDQITGFNAAAFAATVDPAKDPATTRIALQMYREFYIAARAHTVSGFLYALGVYQGCLSAYLRGDKKKAKAVLCYPAEVRGGLFIKAKSAAEGA